MNRHTRSSLQRLCGKLPTATLGAVQVGKLASHVPHFVVAVAVTVVVAKAGSPSSLVAFYDAFTLTRSGYVSIVMEYCSGGSLQDLIGRQGRLKEASIASIALDMAQGLHYMHSLNMLHRDIKPANILLDSEVVRGKPRGAARFVFYRC